MKLRIVFDKYEKRYFLQEKGWFLWHNCYLWDAVLVQSFTTLQSAELYAKQYRIQSAAWEAKKKQIRARDRFVVVNGDNNNYYY